jgi:peptide-methionine (S)-S-oxide reductase
VEDKSEKSLGGQAIFGAGCFWGVEDYFSKIPGVTETEVGYAGGHTENPTYENVCTGTTGHSEVVRIKFDPQVISYENLLDHYFKIHDPTTPNRQGPDIGSQYRSIILYTDDIHRQIAENKIEKLNSVGAYNNKIVTEVVPAQKFFRAEEYHQKYVEKTGHGACHVQP